MFSCLGYKLFVLWKTPESQASLTQFSEFVAHLIFVTPRSPIHRRGLFCLRDIDTGEMVIEYTGMVIRSVLTDKREKYYESKVRKRRLIDLCSFY